MVTARTSGAIRVNKKPVKNIPPEDISAELAACERHPKMRRDENAFLARRDKNRAAGRGGGGRGAGGGREVRTILVMW